MNTDITQIQPCNQYGTAAPAIREPDAGAFQSQPDTDPVPTDAEKRKREGGYSIGEILFWTAVVALGLGFLGSMGLDVFSGQRLNQAQSELNQLLIAGEKYRNTNGAYGGTGVTNVSFQRLRDRAYGMSSYTDGVGENAYGLNMTIASASSGAQATITYQTDTTEACQQLGDQLRNNNMLTVATNPCSGSGPYTLTVTLN